MGNRRGLLLIGCAILAIGGAFLGVRRLRPEPGPVREEREPSSGRPEGVAGEAPSRILGAAGAGAPSATPPPPVGPSSGPESPSSSGTTAPASAAAPPSVGRFRATGVVRSGIDGRGIADAAVEVFLGGEAQGVFLARGKSEEAGRFAIDLPGLDGLSPERRSEVTLAARTRARGFRSNVEVVSRMVDLSGPPRDVEATLHLIAGHDVSGRIVDEVGRPIEAVRVSLDAAYSKAALTTRTDAAGQYRFPILGTGLAYVLARQPGVGTGSIPETSLALEADTTLPDLVLRRGAEVAGTVVDAEGRPAGQVPVFARSTAAPQEEGKAWIGAPSGTRDGSTMTDEDGRFRITGLFPGLVQLRPGTEWIRDEDAVSVETGQENVRLVMAGHLVRVSVVDSGGAVFPAAAWSAQELDGTALRSRQVGWGRRPGPDPSGRRFVVVTPGATVRIGATAPGCAGDEVTRTFAGIGPSDVTLRVVRAGPPGRVRIELTGTGARRAIAQIVTIVRVSGQLVSRPYQGFPEPVGTPMEVPAGKHRIRVVPMESMSERGTFLQAVSLDVDVPSGGDLVVPLPVAVGGRVQVTISLPRETRALDGAMVLESLEGDHALESLPWIQEYRNGVTVGALVVLAPGATYATAQGVPPGRWTLQVYAEGYVTAAIPVIVTAGETTPVTVALERLPK